VTRPKSTHRQRAICLAPFSFRLYFEGVVAACVPGGGHAASLGDEALEEDIDSGH